MILSTFIICRSDDSLRIVFSLICTLYSQAASLQEKFEINQSKYYLDMLNNEQNAEYFNH